MAKEAPFLKKRPEKRSRRLLSPAVIGLGLGFAFAFIYFNIAQAYQGVIGYSESNNVFFGADHLDALRGWVKNHKGTHPLVLLLVVPMGTILESIFSSYNLGMLVFGSFVGGAVVGAFFVMARRLLADTSLAAATTIFFGFSMTQLVFGCLPDTYELATLSLIPVFLLTWKCLRTQNLYLGRWIFCGTLTFAITITSTVQAFLCMAVVVLHILPKGKRLRPLLFLVGSVTAIGFVLCFAQKALIPDAKMFFRPGVYEYEMQYTSPLLVEDPGKVVAETGKTFFLYSFFGQPPIVSHFRPEKRVKLVYYEAPIRYQGIGILGVVLWISLWLRGTTLSFMSRRARPFAVAAGLCILANMALHSYYGTRELFLYTPHFAFVMIFISLNRHARRNNAVRVCTWLVALLAGVINLGVVHNVIETFGTQSSAAYSSPRVSCPDSRPANPSLKWRLQTDT